MSDRNQAIDPDTVLMSACHSISNYRRDSSPSRGEARALHRDALMTLRISCNFARQQIKTLNIKVQHAPSPAQKGKEEPEVY